MDSLLHVWWIWVCAALALAVIEVLLPGFMFLGFSLGAVVTAVVVAIAPGLTGAVILAIFGGLSLVAWVVLRMVFKNQSSPTRIVTRDINDNN